MTFAWSGPVVIAKMDIRDCWSWDLLCPFKEPEPFLDEMR